MLFSRTFVLDSDTKMGSLTFVSLQINDGVRKRFWLWRSFC